MNDHTQVYFLAVEYSEIDRDPLVNTIYVVVSRLLMTLGI